MTIKRILVPTDFSADAEAAMHYAIELARPTGAVVHLLHVVENPLLLGVWSAEMYTAEIAGLQVNLVRDAEERLRQSIPSIAGRPFGLAHEVRTGRAWSTIVDYAADNLIDLIVMGTTGRSGVAHMVMGSVAERVVRSASCPVLTLRAAARKDARPRRATKERVPA